MDRSGDRNTKYNFLSTGLSTVIDLAHWLNFDQTQTDTQIDTQIESYIKDSTSGGVKINITLETGTPKIGLTLRPGQN